jgi:RNA polymerase sigma-70 factor (ECF subfamily)
MTSVVALSVWSSMLPRVAEGDSPRDDLEHEHQAVLAAQRGDTAPLGKLLRVYGPLLYRSLLLPRLGNEAAAKDALAETYAKVVERIGQFRWQGIGVYPWLRTIALRVALDMLRARGRVVFWDEEDVAREIDKGSDAASPDAQLAALHDERAAHDRVRAALARIHPRYARAIEVRLLEERTREEAAELLSVTPATFDVLLHRALRALKKDLEGAKEDKP